MFTFFHNLSEKEMVIIHHQSLPNCLLERTMIIIFIIFTIYFEFTSYVLEALYHLLYILNLKSIYVYARVMPAAYVHDGDVKVSIVANCPFLAAILKHHI